MSSTPQTARASTRRVIVGMSGGVDSAVAALLLKRHGYEVSALFMKNWEDDDTDEYCSSRADLVDAAAAAEVLGIDIDQINFSADYRERVFAHFLAEYRSGRTPNPDVLCNAEIKFRAFLDHALDLGAGLIATGHYARVRERGGRFELIKGLDPDKDQSYFLHRLNQAQLARTLFPVGELRKVQVRRIAREAGLAVHDKKDSTGICFIGERPFREFLARYLPATPGPIKTVDGVMVGRHHGAMYYTLGQREGLGIGGVRGAVEAPRTGGREAALSGRDAAAAPALDAARTGSQPPWYVVAKDIAANTLVVAQGHDHPLLMSRSLAAVDLNWCSGETPAAPLRCTAKTRYRQPDQPCTITAIAGDRGTVLFDSPQRAVTPGQSVVFYDGEVCLGGGVIESTHD